MIKYLYDISFMHFIIAFIIGLIIGYLLLNDKKTVIRYEKNNAKLVYKDNEEKCFKYILEEIKCPNSDVVLDHPIIYN